MSKAIKTGHKSRGVLKGAADPRHMPNAGKSYVQAVFLRAREEDAIEAQHGPVKILMKDGKPFPPPTE
jgi:hypothetical protein